MKKIALLLLLCASSVFAQEKKYQSLLWEVSGNGLTKKSYLYGSMHVSDKVSYHLSDAFFTHLLNADIVANESEPSTWTDLFGMFMPNYGQYQLQFYAGFYQKPVTKTDLYPLFRSNNFTLNNLLFRTNEYNKEYQEETYLDMFIYRTGRKYNKKTVGLEDTKKSILGIINADLTDKPKEENRIAAQKILKNNGYDEALMNFYRDKDLDMIDSLTTLTTSENYLKAMLYDRNIVMVNSIDSLARQGSLFAAIGAAHLPGKKGVIEMLRAKGYTVTPVFDTYTDKGKAKKQQIEEYFSKPGLKRTATPDGMIELPLYNSIIENYENIESPDLANGGYINVKRLLLRDYLKKDNKPFDHKSLDSLFYENIPGNIIDKKFYTQDGYTIYDIKNVTKTGNTQHYRYYITPLEIITVSMSGEGNYVRQFENEVYNSINLKPITSAWKTITPKRGGFSAELPEYTVVYGDREKATNVADIEMYSYDSKEKSNYFIVERTLHDKTLEDTEFELKRIHYQFYTQFDIDSTQTKLSGSPLSFTSSSKLGNKAINLKTVINGSKYYLLGSVGASESNTQRFFNSFTFKPNSSTEDFRTFTDSISHFTLQIPKRQNEKLDFTVKRERMYFDEDEKVNTFSEKFKEHEFTLPSGETVDLTFYQYHRYETRKELDSLWKSFREMVTGRDEDKQDENLPTAVEVAAAAGAVAIADYSDFETKKGITSSTWSKYIDNSRSKRKIRVINEKTSYNEAKNYHQIDLLAVDDRSEQAIKYRGIYREGSSYVLSAMVNKNYKNDDPYLEKVFDSFTLLEHKTEALSQDNLELFIQDAQSEHDSIRYSAFASIHEVKITEKNAQKLIDFIKGYSFKANETNSLVSLYRKLGRVKNPAVILFLEQQYKQDNSNTIIQFAVLNALTLQENKEAYKKIMELLEYDLPLSDGAYEVRSLFSSFEEDTENSEVLFPDILQFYSIQEYHQPIVDFTAKLLDDKSIRPGKLNSYKKMILTNARLELKRVKSRKANQEAEEDEETDYYDDYDYYDDNSQSDDLIGYLNILYPYRHDKKVQPFFADCKALGMNDIDLELARLDITHKNIVKQDIEKLLKRPETRYIAHNMLLTAKENNISKLTDLEIAESALITEGNVKPSKVNIEFLEQKTVAHGNHTINFYFYKLQAKNTDTYMGKNERITAIAFITKDEKIDALAYQFVEPVSVADEEENKETMEAMIDQTLNEYNSRVSFGKMETNYNDILMDEYGDY